VSPAAFPLNLRLPDEQERSFLSANELAHWLDGELAFYDYFASVKLQRSEEPLSSLLTAINNVRSARAQIDQAETFKQASDTANYDATLASTRKRLSMAYSERGLPLATSVEVQALAPIAQHDPVAALAALYALAETAYNGHILTISEPAIARGIGVAACIRYQLLGVGPKAALAGAVDSTIADLQRRAATIHEELEGHLASAAALDERSNQAWDRCTTDQTELATKLTQRVDESIGDAAKNIDDFKESYQAEIALKQPVEFWEKKGKKHERQAVQHGVASLTVAGIAGGLGLKYLPSILEKLAYGGIATAVLLSTLVLWLIRILVRNYMSQTHLATDSDERVAMVKTYLALMESGKAPADTLGPVLAALFRPASDGIVKDDSMPLGLAELLTKQKG